MGLEGLDAEEHNYLRAEVPRHGLRTKFRDGTVQDVALRVLEIAEAGLKRRAILDESGDDESGFLNTLRSAERGYPASEKL